MAIYTRSGTALDSLVATSNSISGSAISTTTGTHEFTFSSPVTIDSTNAAIAVYTDSAADASNYIKVWANRNTLPNTADWAGQFNWNSAKAQSATATPDFEVGIYE